MSSSLPFKIGDRVALPQVGVGSVVGLGPNAAFGKPDRLFYEIRPDRQTSTFYIPTDVDPKERGLRKLMSAKQARQMYDILSTPTPLVSDAEWRRALRDRVKLGDVEEQAALVRDLHTRMAHKRLSSQEKVYLEKAVDALVEEMAESLRHSPEEVRHQVQKSLEAAANELEKVPRA
jgi:RNA polymerase-interacting CarD/CdnL/TRCF family regulator